MKKVAITGGIGVGKSYVCQLLTKYGIQVYDCDAAAKRLMATSSELQSALENLVGNDVYRDGHLQKKVLAQYLLESDANKQAVNDLVHPTVANDFMRSTFSWLESAILFESGFYKRIKFDVVICVTAPLELRISRIICRDGISREKALEWINRQMAQEEIVKLSDYEIVNDGNKNLEQQIKIILSKIEN